MSLMFQWTKYSLQLLINCWRRLFARINATGISLRPSDDADITLNDKFDRKLTIVLTNIKDNKEVFMLRTEKNNDVVGKHGESATNDNGMSLRQLC